MKLVQSVSQVCPLRLNRCCVNNNAECSHPVWLWRDSNYFQGRLPRTSYTYDAWKLSFCIWWRLGTNGPNFRSQKSEPKERCMYTFLSLSTCVQHSWLEKLTVAQLVKIFPVFYGTLSYITTFTKARHVHPVHILLPLFSKTHFNIILLSLSRSFKWPLPGFSSKTCYALIIAAMPATCPAYLTPLNIWRRLQIWRSVCISLHRLLPSLVNTLFLCSINLCSSSNVSDSISHASWTNSGPKTRTCTEFLVITSSDTSCVICLFTNHFIIQNSLI
jgi:hypothetical protein